MNEKSKKESLNEAFKDIEVSDNTFLDDMIKSANGNVIRYKAGESKYILAKKVAEEQGMEYIDLSTSEGLKRFEEIQEEGNPNKKYMLSFPTVERRRVQEEKKPQKEDNIQFNLDQAEDILDDMDLDELPFKLSMEEKLEVFNHMPQLLQGECIMWGASDTEVRCKIGEWLIKTQLGLGSWKEYYDSDVYENYFESDLTVEIVYEKFYV